MPLDDFKDPKTRDRVRAALRDPELESIEIVAASLPALLDAMWQVFQFLRRAEGVLGACRRMWRGTYRVGDPNQP